jgi:hypothetical protein
VAEKKANGTCFAAASWIETETMKSLQSKLGVLYSRICCTWNSIEIVYVLQLFTILGIESPEN